MNKDTLQLIADNISMGIDNATPSEDLRRISGLTERELRKCIEQLRRSGCVIISAPSGGYFKPENIEEVQAHIRKESRRARSIFYTLKSARKLAEDMTAEQKDGGDENECY